MGNSIRYALDLLAGAPLEALTGLGSSALNSIDEIRLRIGRPITLSVGRRDLFLTPSGISDSPANSIQADSSLLEYAFKSAYSYSMHSYSKELASGYITTRGGNRVGICGTAVISGSGAEIDSVKYVSSINIRIAREIIGCAEDIYRECFSDGLCGLLIIGPPSSGKTTVLRDLTRIIGSRYKISLIDELNEISATYKNEAQNDVGLLTDVFSCYPKRIGINTAVRVMSPRAVIVDEIGSPGDEEALSFAYNSGVRLITAVHADGVTDAKNKPAIAALMTERAFKYAAVLNCDRHAEVIKLD